MSDHLSPQALSHLIGSIYDCTLDPSRWEPTLVSLTKVIGTQTAMLALTDMRHNRILLSKTVGMEPRWLEEMGKHAVEIHTMMATARAGLPSPDEPLVLSRHVPRAYLENVALHARDGEAARHRGYIEP